MANKNFQPLSKREVRKAVRRDCPSRIPMVQAAWWGEGLVKQYGDRLKEWEQFSDAEFMPDLSLDYNEMGLSWEPPETASYDAGTVIDDWSKFDEFVEKLPTPRVSFNGNLRRMERAGGLQTKPRPTIGT